ncbi:MAG: TonB-dependent receptor plug domain-containing protein, partial [Schleiferiaceae bacterium]|nr:TonB-dependent receptor plug domain-containing protein [Schleiferiaceae bacterium]
MMGISSPTDSIPQTTTLKAAEVRADKINSGITSIQAKSLTGAALAGESVEGLIRTLSGVVATDELSSQYAVRGGSFDENLLLIEGFEVYRPQLARSGQQEGLSAINPDLVGNLEFSAGGFSVLHGDKLSSVLSVRYQPTAFNLPEGQAQWKVKTGLNASRLA